MVRWRMQLQDWSNSIGVLGVIGEQDYLLPVEFKVTAMAPDGMVIEPTMRFSHSEAQDWMNELWRLGFRPNDGEASTSHVEAMKDHIATLKLSHDALIQIATRRGK